MTGIKKTVGQSGDNNQGPKYAIRIHRTSDKHYDIIGSFC